MRVTEANFLLDNEKEVLNVLREHVYWRISFVGMASNSRVYVNYTFFSTTVTQINHLF